MVAERNARRRRDREPQRECAGHRDKPAKKDQREKPSRMLRVGRPGASDLSSADPLNREHCAVVITHFWQTCAAERTPTTSPVRCSGAICEDGRTRSPGRVPSTPDGIQTLAESLLPSDRVALEVTGSYSEVCRILEPHVNRVVVVSPDDTGISSARAKTDRLDARTLASLLWKGELEAVWMPDERCRVLRRRLARREQLVRARTRSKNEIHAALQRRLQAKPPCSDLFGVKGRR